MRCVPGLGIGLVFAVAACNGVIGEPGLQGAASDDGESVEPGAPSFGADPEAAGERAAVTLPARLWRLSPAQYDAELVRLFGEGVPLSGIPAAAGESGIENVAAPGRVDVGNVRAFADSARSVARWAVDSPERLRCDDMGSSDCVDRLVAWLLDEAWRRPATAAERASLRAVYDDLAADYEAEYAFEGVIRAALLSPEFLFRTELGEAETGTTTLTGHEIATLLAFGITRESPDDALLADVDRLADPDVRESHARRLMERSAGAWQDFFWQWLHMATLESQGAEVDLPRALVAAMEAESRRFIEEVVVRERGTLQDLLTTSHSWVTPELATHYGATHPGDGVARVELDSAQRAGLLTLGAWLVAHGKKGHANVVRRGMAIWRDAMCREVMVPDIDLESELAELVPEDASVVEIVEARAGAPSCGACHVEADPMGLAFESYASDGSWQESYADGAPVETRVELGEQSFDGAVALSGALLESGRFRQCLVRRFAHYLVGADLGSPRAGDYTGAAYDAFEASGGSFEELLVALVRHPVFAERSYQ